MHLYPISFVALVLCISEASADVTPILDDKSQWQSAVGAYTTLTFTDLPNFTVVTNQYAIYGVTFPDGNDHVHTTTAYSDGHGLVSSDPFGTPGTIHMAFNRPRYGLALDYVGVIKLELYSMGRLIFASNAYGADFHPFVGFVSTTPFDAAIVRDPFDSVVAIDDLHFGPPVPAPGGMVILGLAAAGCTRRRRS